MGRATAITGTISEERGEGQGRNNIKGIERVRNNRLGIRGITYVCVRCMSSLPSIVGLLRGLHVDSMDRLGVMILSYMHGIAIITVHGISRFS